MKILQIELSADEQTAIFNELTKRFGTEDAKQTVEFDLLDLFQHDPTVFDCDDLYSCESVLELYTEYPERDENNQTSISSRSIIKFRITFFHDGEEVAVKDWDIEDRIRKYYEI